MHRVLSLCEIGLLTLVLYVALMGVADLYDRILREDLLCTPYPVHK